MKSILGIHITFVQSRFLSLRERFRYFPVLLALDTNNFKMEHRAHDTSTIFMVPLTSTLRLHKVYGA